MFQIGDSLREARIRRGLSPADVHKAIRIRERYLSALEEERWDMLPGEAYTKGFLRTYAEHLGLNSQLYIDEYNARIARYDEDPPRSSRTRRTTRGSLKRGILVALAAVLVVGAAVAGLAAWRLGGTSTPPSQSAPPPSGAGSVAAAASTPPVTAKTTPTLRSSPLRPRSRRITAARGRCWLLVRARRPERARALRRHPRAGPDRALPARPRLWVRMGRPTALDITRRRQARRRPPGSPSNVVLPHARRGVAYAA